MKKDFSNIKLCKDCKHFDAKSEMCARDHRIEFDPVFGETKIKNLKDCREERVDLKEKFSFSLRSEYPEKVVEWYENNKCTLEAQFFEPK